MIKVPVHQELPAVNYLLGSTVVVLIRKLCVVVMENIAVLMVCVSSFPLSLSLSVLLSVSLSLSLSLFLTLSITITTVTIVTIYSGYTCDVSAGTCQRSDATAEAVKMDDSRNIEEPYVKCDDKSSCPSGTTCCKLSSGEYGCCPYKKAVCCSDGEHCCPNGMCILIPSLSLSLFLSLSFSLSHHNNCYHGNHIFRIYL